MHRLEKARARAPGAQSAELVLQAGVRRLHPAFEVFEIEFGQLRHDSSITFDS